jgi:hypothetical protein
MRKIRCLAVGALFLLLLVLLFAAVVAAADVAGAVAAGFAGAAALVIPFVSGLLEARFFPKLLSLLLRLIRIAL